MRDWLPVDNNANGIHNQPRDAVTLTPFGIKVVKFTDLWIEFANYGPFAGT